MGKRKKPGAEARREKVRQSVADWLTQVRGMLNLIVAGASNMAAEADANPDGEVARAIGGGVVNLHNLAVDANEADATAAGIYLSMSGRLPDPVAVARG